MNKDPIKILVRNPKASFNYFLSDFLECGLELKGTEIKSIKCHGATISDAYVLIKNGEAYVLNMRISPYEKGNLFNHDPLRTRRLLLHKHEIDKISAKMNEKGYAIIPTKLYLKKGKAKIEIALGKGKKNFDKRESIKKRDDSRAIDKAIKNKGREL